MNDAKRAEVSRILREVAERVENGENSGQAQDINGNTCTRFQSYRDSFQVGIRTENAAFQVE